MLFRSAGASAKKLRDYTMGFDELNIIDPPDENSGGGGGGGGGGAPNLDDVYPTFAPNERDDAKKVLESLVSGGELVMLTPQICWHKDVYEDVWEKVLAYFEENEELTAAQFRDMMNTTRKYALAVLEYYDKQKLTRYDGEARRLIWKR